MAIENARHFGHEAWPGDREQTVNGFADVQNNGINGVSIDLPNVVPGNLQINHDPRNGRPYFDTSLFSPNVLGTPGNASRRFFYGPGVDNYDLALHKLTKFDELRTLDPIRDPQHFQPRAVLWKRRRGWQY